LAAAFLGALRFAAAFRAGAFFMLRLVFFPALLFRAGARLLPLRAELFLAAIIRGSCCWA
jgi:hypothetical protein